MNTHSRRVKTALIISLVAAMLTACSSTPAKTAPAPTLTAVVESSTLVPPTATASPAQLTSEAPLVASQTGCPVTQTPSVAKSATLTLGPSTGITATTAKGEKLVIVGTVYVDDCTPVADASLNVWQTDADGEYGPGHNTGDLQCCYLQGTVSTDANGHYQLTTVKPGHYAGEQPPPPAHIHVEVEHADMQSLMTEIVFADDPYLSQVGSEGLIITSLAHAAGPDGAYLYLRGVADIVLQRSTAASPTRPAATTQARTFQIVPEQSEAAYQIREKFAIFPVTTSAVGVTPLLEGFLQVKLDDPPALQSLTMTVDLRGLKSDEPNRDEKLVDHWLVTQHYPLATFAATEIQNGPAHYTEGEALSFTLIGDLTIRDVTRSVAFAVSARLTGETLTGSATGTLKMTDFGIDPPNLLGFVEVEDEVLVTVNFTAKEIQALP